MTLVSPEATEHLVARARAGEIAWRRRGFADEDLDGAFLVVTAADEQELNDRVEAEARRRKILICDASSGHRSSLIFGALHQTKAVTVAVFTDGEDPALARRTRDAIAALEEDWEER